MLCQPTQVYQGQNQSARPLGSGLGPVSAHPEAKENHLLDCENKASYIAIEPETFSTFEEEALSIGE